ncbi:MAG: hypothetical protein WBD15_20980 [Pseudolabrys sp.]
MKVFVGERNLAARNLSHLRAQTAAIAMWVLALLFSFVGSN